MPQIKEFQGWRYNPLKIRDFSAVLAPPYDVISENEQENLTRKSPFNVVRLILGQEACGDNARQNKYIRAKCFLESWMKERIFIQEKSPSLYVYVQDYREQEKLKSRLGFIAAMKLDDKAILRHENTLAAPKKDRWALLKEVRTNLSPLFGLFEDKSGGVQKILKTVLRSRPCLDVTIDRVRHRLFVESRPAAVRAICSRMRPKPMLIADGHHRLEVAFQYKKLIGGRSKAKGGRKEGAWDYVMTYFSDCDHNPFVIYPTHRLLKQPAEVGSIEKLLAGRGEIKKVSGLPQILSKLSKPRSESGSSEYSFGVFTKAEGFFIFNLKRRFLALGNPVDRLDVAVLHKSIIGPLFGIDTIEKSQRIDFTRDAKEAVEQVKKGVWDWAFFLRPTSLREMIVVSKKGLKMPQKSTYFYPKLLSGLVFHRLDEGDLTDALVSI